MHKFKFEVSLPSGATEIKSVIAKDASSGFDKVLEQYSIEEIRLGIDITEVK